MPKLRDNISLCEEGAGKENMSMMNESISPEDASERMLTMENFLRDFDIQVKERIKNMESAMKKALAELTRLGNSEKLKISKEIRTMTVKDFLEKGGDLEAFEFKEISNALNSTLEVSFAQSSRDSDENVPLGSLSIKSKGKRPAEPSLLQDTLKKSVRTTRARAATGGPKNSTASDITTPVIRQTKTRRIAAGKKELPTPMITPKFDPSKPLKSAREPNLGETLVSLSGSPVVVNRGNISGDANNTELVSISMSTDQAILGGQLFVDDGLSPNTLHKQKQVIEEAMAAINSRLDALSQSSKLDMS